MAYFNSLYFEDKVDLYKIICIYVPVLVFVLWNYYGMSSLKNGTTVWYAKGEIRTFAVVFLGRIQGFDPTTGIFFAMAAISRWACWEDAGKMGFCSFLLAYNGTINSRLLRIVVAFKKLRVRDIVLKNLHLSQTTSPDMMIALTLGEPLVCWP